jgi:hypothetical protein
MDEGGSSTLDIFLDESGDLGWSPGSSRHLVIATVCTRQRRRLRKMLRRVKAKNGVPASEELKAFRASRKFRTELLTALSGDSQCYCRAIVIHKPNVVPKLRTSNLLYNYAAGLLLAPHIRRLSRVNLCVDPRELKVDAPFTFDEYLRVKLYAEMHSEVELTIERPESSVSPGLQVADFVANAAFRHFESGEQKCFGCIRPRLELRRLYFAAERSC